MGDRSDKGLTGVDISRQQRFLEAYSQEMTVAAAARKAHIHRSSVYRWRSDPAFREAMSAAWKRGYRRWLVEVHLPQERARQAARELRNRELRPMRREVARRNLGRRRYR